MIELAKKIIELTGSASRIVHRPLPENDSKQRRPDITRARALGWKPRTKIKDGLLGTIEYFDKLLSEGKERGKSFKRTPVVGPARREFEQYGIASSS